MSPDSIVSSPVGNFSARSAVLWVSKLSALTVPAKSAFPSESIFNSKLPIESRILRLFDPVLSLNDIFRSCPMGAWTFPVSSLLFTVNVPLIVASPETLSWVVCSWLVCRLPEITVLPEVSTVKSPPAAESEPLVATLPSASTVKLPSANSILLASKAWPWREVIGLFWRYSSMAWARL